MRMWLVVVVVALLGGCSGNAGYRATPIAPNHRSLGGAGRAGSFVQLPLALTPSAVLTPPLTPAIRDRDPSDSIETRAARREAEARRQREEAAEEASRVSAILDQNRTDAQRAADAETAFLTPTVPAPRPGKKFIAGWRVSVEKDRMDDSLQYSATLDSPDLVSLGKLRRHPVLSVWCIRGALGVDISAGLVVDEDAAELRFRYGKGEPVTNSAIRFDSLTGVVFDETTQILMQFSANKAEQVTVELPVFRGGFQFAHFALKGVDQVIAEAVSTCTPAP